MTKLNWASTFRFLFHLAPNRLAMWLAKQPTPLPVAEVIIVGRRTGLMRRHPLTVLTVDGHYYIGHPNGRCHWVENLTVAGTATVIKRDSSTIFRAVELADGPERDGAIRATSQQPFPVNLLYRAARRHICAVGTFFRLEPTAGEALR